MILIVRLHRKKFGYTQKNYIRKYIQRRRLFYCQENDKSLFKRLASTRLFNDVIGE